MFEEKINSLRDEIVADLIDLLKIDTAVQKKKPNMPFGEGLYKGLRFVIDKGSKFDFKCQNYCGYCGQLQAGNGNYTVGILCNLDVKEDDDNLNNVRIEDGIIYGNGALRGKGPMIACIYAMKLLKENEMIPKDKKLSLVAISDRWSGFKSINYYKEYEEAPEIGFTPDGKFPVIYGEKGSIEMKLAMKVSSSFDAPINVVEIVGGDDIHKVPSKVDIILSCDDIFKLKIEEDLKEFALKENIKYSVFSQNKLMSIQIKGRSAAGCKPERGKNAISYGIKFLHSMEELLDKRQFINEYEKLISTTYNGEKIGCNFSDKESGKFTFNVGKIELLNDIVNLYVDARFPISTVYSDVFEKLNSAFKYSPMKIEEISHIRPVSFLEDSFVVKKLKKSYDEVTGDLESKPYETEGTTYARALSNIVCFGPENNEFELKKQKEEHISVDYLLKLTEIYARALYELLN